MQTAREYLVGLGLAKAGVRGGFSREAHKALKNALDSGMTFKDWDKNGRIIPDKNKVRVVKIPGQTTRAAIATRTRKPLREHSRMLITEKNGTKIVLDSHSVCGNSIRFCTCRKLEPPKYMDVASFVLE